MYRDQASRRRARELAPCSCRMPAFRLVRMVRRLARCGRRLLRLHRFRRSLHRRAGGARIRRTDMPIGILGSLVDLHRALHRRLRPADRESVHYSRLNVGAPVSLAIRETGVKWGSYVVNAGRSGRTQHGHAGHVARPVARLLLHGARRLAVEVGGRHPSHVSGRRGSRPIVIGCSVAFFASLVPIGDLGQTGLHRHPAGIRHRLRRRLGDAPQAGLTCIGPSRRRWCPLPRSWAS